MKNEAFGPTLYTGNENSDTDGDGDQRDRPMPARHA